MVTGIFAALSGPTSVKNDPLTGLLEIANNMARDHQFDYDVASIRGRRSIRRVWRG